MALCYFLFFSFGFQTLLSLILCALFPLLSPPALLKFLRFTPLPLGTFSWYLFHQPPLRLHSLYHLLHLTFPFYFYLSHISWSPSLLPCVPSKLIPGSGAGVSVLPSLGILLSRGGAGAGLRATTSKPHIVWEPKSGHMASYKLSLKETLATEID